MIQDRRWFIVSLKAFIGLVLSLGFVLLSDGTAWGQAYTSLKGTVTDPTGAVVSGATVTLTNVNTGVSRSTTTDATGTYQFTQVPPGTYSVRVEAPGFKTTVREQVELLVATPTTLNIELEVGEVTEIITIEAPEAPTINTVDATIGNPFREEEVKSLPFLARNPVNMLTLQPGVVFTGESDTDLLFMGSVQQLDDREGVVNGVLGNQTNITVDGVDANDWQNQAAFTSALPVTLDSLQEFRVITTNANATEGVAAGAQVALVTKSGSNEFHGNLRWYHRNDATAANAFFNNQAGLPVPKLIRNIAGGSLGGRIIRDRVFFFGDYETRRDRSEDLVLRIVPTEPLKRGILTYETVTGEIAQLTPEQIRALDPAGLGVNPAMLQYMSNFPVGNDPSQGLDAGLNFIGFRFNGPINTDNNIWTARFDFNLTKDGRHTAFWRGTLGDIKRDLLPAQFPGLPTAAVLLNNSKGFVAGYTAQFSPTLINTFRWGFTRLGIAQSGRDGAEFAVRSFSTHINYNRAFGRKVPTHEFKDDLTWVRGAHTFQFGATVRIIRNDRFTKAISFPEYFVNNGFCLDLCRDAVRALRADDDPNNDPADPTAFTRAFMMLTGSITQVDASFFVDPKTLSFLPAGSPQAREFASNHFEGYAQDSWRIRPNVTLTFGVRYSYFSPIWETSGAQVRPTFDLREWWNLRQQDMLAGIPSDASPLLRFELAGKENGKPAWWRPDKNNVAPRIAIAWSPGFDRGIGKILFGGPGRSSIRAGFGVFYYRMGGAIAVDTDVNGSPGLANSLINSAGTFSLATAPRFSGTCGPNGCSGLPPLDQFLPIPTTASFPHTPVPNFSNVGFIVDTNLVHPYSMNVNFSIQRELPGSITVDVAYVGTFGRKLLTKTDFSQYYGFFTDPTSGMNLWQAYNQIVDLIGPDPFNPAIDPFDPQALAAIPPIPFFENLMPNLPNYMAQVFGLDFLANLTPTQAFYTTVALFAPSWSDPLFFAIDTPPRDVGISPWSTAIDPEQDGGVLFQPQFQALPGWINWGSSTFHSLQISIRRNIGSSLFGINYVLSKSIDNGSVPENGDLFTGLGSFNGQIPNPFLPGAHRAVSDFDIRHNFNAHWVVDLPFGHGHRLGGQVRRALDYLIGGWQIVGAWRWRSGFPLSPGNGFNFPTNFFLTGPSTVTGKIASKVTRNDPNGVPNLFSNPDAVRSRLQFTRPGEVGSRNIVRSDDFVTVDLGINKSFRMPWNENHRLQFRWTAFNVFNNVNFDTTNIDFDIESQATFGRIFSTAGPRGGAREMQFVLRYEF